MPSPKLPPGEVCHICGKKAELRERDAKRNWTGKYLCRSHYQSDYYRNIQSSNQNQGHENIKEDNTLKLVEESELQISSKNPKSKIYTSFDGKNFFWIVTENGKIINKNPIEEDLIGIKEYSYNKINICYICRDKKEKEEIELTDKSILYPGNAYQERDKNGKATGKWTCPKHWKRDRDQTERELDPTKTLGDNCEKLTDKLFGAKRLSVKYDNYKLSLDHSPIPDRVIMIGGKLVDLSGKIPETKGRHYNPRHEAWFADILKEYHKKFDILIFYCISEDGKIIEMMYIFPKEDIIKIKSISMYKNPKNRWGCSIISINERHKVTDEEEIKRANGIWQKIIEENPID